MVPQKFLSQLGGPLINLFYGYNFYCKLSPSGRRKIAKIRFPLFKVDFPLLRRRASVTIIRKFGSCQRARMSGILDRNYKGRTLPVARSLFHLWLEILKLCLLLLGKIVKYQIEKRNKNLCFRECFIVIRTVKILAL